MCAPSRATAYSSVPPWLMAVVMALVRNWTKNASASATTMPVYRAYDTIRRCTAPSRSWRKRGFESGWRYTERKLEVASVDMPPLAPLLSLPPPVSSSISTIFEGWRSSLRLALASARSPARIVCRAWNRRHAKMISAVTKTQIGMVMPTMTCAWEWLAWGVSGSVGAAHS